MRDDALVVIVDGPYYEACLPLFVWGAINAIPDSHIIVGLRDDLPSALRKAVAAVEGPADRVRYIEKLGAGFPRDPKTTKMLRWTLGHNEFQGIKRAWIGDVDILLAPEQPDLHEQHQLHADRMNLPYSNILTRDAAGPQLSGLHWINVDQYLDATADSIGWAHRLIETGKAQGRWKRDRHMLHDMVDRSRADLPTVDCSTMRSEASLLRPPDPCFRPHHGLHLRLWATAAIKKTEKLRNSPAYTRYKQLLKDALTSPNSSLPIPDHPILREQLANLRAEIGS